MDFQDLILKDWLQEARELKHKELERALMEGAQAHDLTALHAEIIGIESLRRYLLTIEQDADNASKFFTMLEETEND